MERAPSASPALWGWLGPRPLKTHTRTETCSCRAHFDLPEVGRNTGHLRIMVAATVKTSRVGMLRASVAVTREYMTLPDADTKR